MKFLVSVAILFLSFFPFFNSPITLGTMLVILSFTMVSIMSVNSSWWFSYILFLVYIGGLLVIFVYICLISSNYGFHFMNPSWALLLSVMISYLFSVKPAQWDYLGMSVYSMGEMLLSNEFIWLFEGLMALLLVVLLIVVRNAGVGAISLN